MAKAPYFKAGDTLLVPITFEDTATNLGITLDDALEVSARIVDERNKLISDVQVTKDPDQTTYPGRFLLRVLDFVTVNIASAGANVFSKNYQGKKIAIVSSQIPYNWERHDQNIRGYSFIFNITNSVLNVKYDIAAEWRAYTGSITGSAARNDVFQPYGNFLVVDITNY
ncbi:hypothetical protein [Acinetobacter brisouii]|uniref:hypothetical protein n=1 Tax=Acinetobacter brisouii TaxID=396323 RepID=UPI00124E346D|nr:hypothetical protein [Acinetobacter brisouii]